MSNTEQFITLSGVERTFSRNDRQVRALRGIDMAIGRGAFVVLMGPSGSGKTTLLNLVGGLDQPTAGEIEVEGRRLSALNSAELAALRRRTGFIFQSFALLPTASAYENVELGLRLAGDIPRREWDARVRRCIAAVGLGAWIDHRPYELSGGQQQRVAIARSLALQPQVMLFDEVTSALDPELTSEVLGVMEDLARRGMTMITVTHEMGFARRVADLVVFMHQGKVWEIGPTAALFAEPRTPEFRQFVGSEL